MSYYLDYEAGRAPGDTVHKIHPSAYIKVSAPQHSFLILSRLTKFYQLFNVEYLAGDIVNLHIQCANFCWHISYCQPSSSEPFAQQLSFDEISRERVDIVDLLTIAYLSIGMQSNNIAYLLLFILQCWLVDRKGMWHACKNVATDVFLVHHYGKVAACCLFKSGTLWLSLWGRWERQPR